MVDDFADFVVALAADALMGRWFPQRRYHDKI